MATGAILDIADMNPYDDSTPGIDVTGDGIEIDFGTATSLVPHIRAFKIPLAGFTSPTDIRVKIHHRYDTEYEWWDPDGTLPPTGDGSLYSLESSLGSDYHGLHKADPAVGGWRPFSATKVRIRGSGVTNLRLDLIGQIYDRDVELQTAESTYVGCGLMSSDDQALELVENSVTLASTSCASHCAIYGGKTAYYTAVRRVAAFNYRCLCLNYGSDIGKISGTACLDDNIYCNEIQEKAIAQFEAQAGLISFITG